MRQLAHWSLHFDQLTDDRAEYPVRPKYSPANEWPDEKNPIDASQLFRTIVFVGAGKQIFDQGFEREKISFRYIASSIHTYGIEKYG